MKYLLAFLTALFFFLTACKENNIAPSEKHISFPEFFVEKGSDLDTTYISLRGINKINNFEIQATGWGIWEYGLFLNRNDDPNSVNYSLMGFCGTVSTKTWRKVTFNDFLTPEELDTIDIISFTDFRDTISIGYVSVH